MQGFDQNKPATNDPVRSEPVRTNFQAIASCHAGANPPSSPQTGWLWLDTSDPTNYRLRQYVSGAWLVILNNLAGGAPSQSTVSQYVHEQTVGATTWTITHSLDTEDINVQFWDSSGALILPDTVSIVSSNVASATFLVAQTGKAVVLG